MKRSLFFFALGGTVVSAANSAGCDDIQSGCQTHWCGDAYWKSQCLKTCDACGDSPTKAPESSPTMAPEPSPTIAPASPTTVPPSPASDCNDIQSGCQTHWCGNEYWKGQCKRTCGACSGDDSTVPNPTYAPTNQVTKNPTATPTSTTTTPAVTTTTSSGSTVTTPATTTTTSTSGGGTDNGNGHSDYGAGVEVLQRLQQVSTADRNEVMKSQHPDLSWHPSTIYKWDDMIKGIQDMYEVGVGGQKFWLGDEGETNPDYGLVSIAAFVAQSMKETIKYDVCDENNWDSTSGNSAANSCGQLGQSYQDYNCPAGEEHMQCDVDPNMAIRASTSATWYGAPAPMFCGPKSLFPKAPKWSTSGAWCNPKEIYETNMTLEEYSAYIESGEGCRDYPGQKDGRWVECAGAGCANNAAPAFGREARTDVEGCCWWGRGVIQTTGVCNFGKFNYFMGAKAASRGEPALFPDIDFCRTPDAICTSTEYPELKWIAGLFFWVKELQGYDQGGWNYFDVVKKFVDGGMQDSSFIDSVSGIVNRGCHNPPCAAGAVDGGPERRENFETVLKAMGVTN